MPDNTCSRCGVRLFGPEVDRGICENCEGSRPAISEKPVEREYGRASSFSSPEYSRSLERGYGPGPFDRIDEPEFGPSRGLNWGFVRTGLGMIFWGLLLYPMAIIAMIALAFCGAMSAAAASGGGGGGGGGAGGAMAGGIIVVLALIIGGVMALASVLLVAIGQCLFVAVPTGGSLRGLAIGNMVCLALYIIMTVLRTVLPILFMNEAMDSGVVVAIGLALVQFVISIAWAVCFFGFFRGLASYFQDRSLATQFIVFPITWIAVVIGTIVVLVLLGGAAAYSSLGGGGGTGFRGDDMAGFILIGICFLAVVMIAMYIWFLILISRLRGLVGRGYEPRAASAYYGNRW